MATKKRDVRFTPKERDLIRVLVSETPEHWGTLEHITRKLYSKDLQRNGKIVERYLEGLGPKLNAVGIKLDASDSPMLQEKVYTIDPSAAREGGPLDQLLRSRKKNTTVMYIPDPGFGQILHDSYSDLGAHYFLKWNGLLNHLDAVLVVGAVPYIPETGTRHKSEYLKILGKKIPGTKFPDDPEEASGESYSVAEQEFRRKHVDNKITTIPEAIESGAKSLETILGRDFSGDVHLFFGYQDFENLDVKLKKLKSDYSELKKQQEASERRAEKTQEQYELDKKKYKALEAAAKFAMGLSAYAEKAKNKDQFKKRMDGYYERRKEDLDFIKGEWEEQYDYLETTVHRNARGNNDLAKRAATLTKKRDELKTKIETLKQQLDAEVEKGANVERHLRNFRVYKFLGHMPTDAKLDNTHFYQAMHEYLDEVGNLWPQWEGSTAHIHPEGITYLDLNGFIFRTESKMNKRSNDVGTSTLKQQLLRMANGRRPIPHAYAAAHDAGGYRVMPFMRVREKIMEGSYEAADEVGVQIKLPTMHSEDALEWCVDHNIVNLWDVKRWMKGNYASGIPILEFSEDGNVVNAKMVYTSTLIKMGRRAVEYESIKKELKEGKMNAQKRTELEEMRVVLEESFKLEPNQGKLEPTLDKKILTMIDIALMPENHDGSPNVPGRTTSPELLEAIIKYQRERQPDMIIFCGDNVHGDHNTSTFKTAKQDLGMLPYESRSIGKIIREDPSLTSNQKLALLNYLQFMNRVTQPVTSVSKQLLNFADCGALQLLEETVDREGMGAIISGNHYNSSSGQTHDEAHVLSLGLDRKYRKGGRVWVVDGIAERDGRGEIPLTQLGDKYKDHSLDYGTLYGAHSYGSGSDVLLGMMQKVEAMRLKSRAVIGGHVHQTGAATANGIDFFITSGSQTDNKYVEAIGKMASFRGAMNVRYSRNPDLYNGYHQVTWASQKYLEDRFLTEETWAHKLIVEKYLPLVRGRALAS